MTSKATTHAVALAIEPAPPRSEPTLHLSEPTVLSFAGLKKQAIRKLLDTNWQLISDT